MICQKCPFFQESDISTQFGVCDDVEFTPVRRNWEFTAICESKLKGFKFVKSPMSFALERGDWEISIPVFGNRYVVTNRELRIGVEFDLLSEAIGYCDKHDQRERLENPVWEPLKQGELAYIGSEF
jgi:hypothetical protein